MYCKPRLPAAWCVIEPHLSLRLCLETLCRICRGPSPCLPSSVSLFLRSTLVARPAQEASLTISLSTPFPCPLPLSPSSLCPEHDPFAPTASPPSACGPPQGFTSSISLSSPSRATLPLSGVTDILGALVSHTLPARSNPTSARTAAANPVTCTIPPADASPAQTLDTAAAKALVIALALLLRGVLGAVAADGGTGGRTLLQGLVRIADHVRGELRDKAAAAIWEVSR
jgi:hypothetical protein